MPLRRASSTWKSFRTRLRCGSMQRRLRAGLRRLLCGERLGMIFGDRKTAAARSPGWRATIRGLRRCCWRRFQHLSERWRQGTRKPVAQIDVELVGPFRTIARPARLLWWRVCVKPRLGIVMVQRSCRVPCHGRCRSVKYVPGRLPGMTQGLPSMRGRFAARRALSVPAAPSARQSWHPAAQCNRP